MNYATPAIPHSVPGIRTSHHLWILCGVGRMLLTPANPSDLSVAASWFRAQAVAVVY